MTPTDHPSEQDLSAVLDGERGASVHVRRCAQCRTRVEQLRAASLAVAAPVALPDPAVRDAAIARAVAAAPGPAGATASSKQLRERWIVRLRRPLLAGGAAVTAIAAVVALFVFAGSHNEEAARQAALKSKLSARAPSSTAGGLAYAVGAPGPNRTERAPPRASAAAGTGALPPSPGLAMDLGDVPDGAALRARVGPAVHRSGTSEQRTAAASGTPTGGASPAPAAAPQRDASASAADVPPPYSGPPPPCEAVARSLGPAKDRLIYAANAKWQGTAAVVLAFVPEPPAAGAVRVYVMEQGSCRMLFSDSYDQ